MRREFARVLSAAQLLTRLPLPDPGWERGRLARAARWYPAVGFLLALPAAGLWLALNLALPSAAAAGLALLLLIVLTGGLHEDGLADTADALGGHAPRERALEIMRDSRIGTYGALALVFSLGLRWAALASFDPEAGALALLVALPAGRAGIALTLALGAYAREEGAAREAAGTTRGEAGFAILTAACAALLCGAAGMLALALALALAALLLRFTTRRIGGYTGDTLGTAEQFGHTGALLLLAGLL
ncbi:MAG: adenosylcobinamide-GDP ribazoletransferase [Pikeienuella sp.]|uniref:adenosylcobinamide-GDP ribazoletransferase n=1 Tax=Pikeienuella sp. TaxID=2831957 RepID=UPI00391D26C6